MEEKYKFIAYSLNDSKEVFPKNGNTFAISYEREDNSATLSPKFEGSLIFQGEDFHWLHFYENSIYKCIPIEIEVQKKCEGEYIEFFRFKLILNSGNWNIDQCEVKISPNIEDKYSCYEENKDQEVNLFQLVSGRESISLLSGVIEYDSCEGSYIVGEGEEDCDSQGDILLGWSLIRRYKRTDLINNGTETLITYRYVWARETKSSLIPLSYPWISIGGNNYAKQPIKYNYQQTSEHIDPSTDIFEETWQVGINGVSFDNGMKLKSVFESLLNESCPDLILKSNFFQWNPDIETNINYVTAQASEVSNLILFQKSDIKRPNVSGNATIANTTFEQMLNDICNIFNLKWDIDEEDNFIIEHVSFFNKNTGLDLIGRFDAYLREGMNQYSYNLDDMPKREIFSMMDNSRQYSRDFVGKPILYKNSCAGLGDKKEEVYQVENIMTDIQFCLDNSSSESQVVSDEGFVLVACDSANGIIVGMPILDSSESLNNILSWAHLHEKYWRHDRIFKEMNMNGVEKTAYTVRPNKKQITLPVVLCCGDTFNPNEKIISELGEGVIQSAVYNLYDEVLNVELLHQTSEANTNQKPVVVNDTAETFKNINVEIDVLANDTDPDDNIDPDSITIVNMINGTASVVDQKVLFSPNADFVGTANIYYKIYDTFHEESNIGTVTITVKNGTPNAIANDDFFTIVKNGTLTGDVLTNDAGDGLLQAIPETKSTDEGGSIQILSNGSFTYTPASNFVGVDTVEYTMKDSNDDEDSAIIQIDVFAGQTVYASLSVTESEQFHECDYDESQPQEFGGNVSARKFVVNFYSDAGKTTPLDVTGYNINLILRYDQTGDNAHTGQYGFSLVNSGTSFDFGGNWFIASFVPCNDDPSFTRIHYLAPSTQFIIV